MLTICRIALISQEAVNQEKLVDFEKKGKKKGDIVKKDHFQDFFKAFNDKYKEIAINPTHVAAFSRQAKKKFTLNFSKDKKRVLYHHEELEVNIDIEYNHFSIFEILISWNLCCSVIIKEFIDNIMTLGRRNNLNPSLLSSGDIFHIAWSITTIGEIIL